MIFSFLDDKNIFERYQAAKKYTDTLTVPFPEFERIADNKPFEGIDPAYPNTTDGTTASIIRKTPRRVIQQLPTGTVKTDDDDDWLGIVAEFIFTNKIIPYANEEYDLIQKCWVAVEDSLTFGSCAVYTPFLNHDGYFCPDMTTLYWGDVAIQPGKKSLTACNYFFMRSWWQKEDIDALIDKETKLAASSKKRGEKYESTWDIEALKELKDSGETTKDQQARTPVENDRGLDARGIEIVTGFQKGVGAKFYTFASGAKKIIRTEENKDPRGKYPIDVIYGDVDGTNPFGRSVVELIGPLQNLIDTDMQMYQYNRALMLAPPMVVTGNISKSQVSLSPNAVMKITDPNGKIVPLTIDTTAIANYPQLYQLQQSQLFNLISSPTNGTLSSTDVALGQGKTPTALNQQKAALSVEDNYVTKMFESLFQHWGETAINLYFAKRSGVEELQLDDDTADRLKKLADEGKFDPSQLSPDNKIRIDYDTATPALNFRVDASSSKMKDDADQLQGLELLSTSLTQSPWLVQIVPQDKQIALWNKLVSVSGIEDPEELEVTPEDVQQQQQMAQAQQMQQAQMVQAQQQAQVAQQPQQPAQPDPSQEPPLVSHLRQLGLSDPAIQQVVTHALQQGGTNG